MQVVKLTYTYLDKSCVVTRRVEEGWGHIDPTFKPVSAWKGHTGRVTHPNRPTTKVIRRLASAELSMPK